MIDNDGNDDNDDSDDSDDNDYDNDDTSILLKKILLLLLAYTLKSTIQFNQQMLLSYHIHTNNIILFEIF